MGPSLHSRSYGGTCILWRSNLNPRIKCLPESSERINVVELRADPALFCLVNVYLPTRGLAMDEMLFDDSPDMLHEIILKYSISHTIVLGGDFNSYLHRETVIRRDTVFKEFVREHNLEVDSDYQYRTCSFMSLMTVRLRLTTFWWQCLPGALCHTRSGSTTCTT